MTSKVKQLRGEALVSRIEAVLKEHAQQAKKNGHPFVLNKAAIARDVPCTRKTLLSYDDHITKFFNSSFEQGARRSRDGSVELARLKEKLSKSEERALQLEQENKALMALHAKMFDTLVMAGIHPSVLNEMQQNENVLTFPTKERHKEE